LEAEKADLLSRVADLELAFADIISGEVRDIPMAQYEIRIIANACITRYDVAEGSIDEIVDRYNLSVEDRDAVLNYIFQKRPDIGQSVSEYSLRGSSKIEPHFIFFFLIYSHANSI
jgi:hypothetical protein